MTREEIVEKTLDTFRNVFGEVDGLTEQTSADDIGKWDSLNHVILIQELEKAFDMKFDLFEIIEIRDVAGIVNYIFANGK
ncbi:acyl carrier protein [Mariniphaga anaerophila]|uniref:Acyl carrier protein n=1 Tax=Mariniphaga anaerophila TaxID=1484053 RepID=A0A1M5B8H4_9BACT|nr:acyl carrier protein [Mariniphaga anaerophila]SHF38706.1 acyl carrier protein [Mariniphaga anaerophila]